MLFRAADEARGASLSEGARRHMRGLGFALEQGDSEQVDGLPAYVATYAGKAKTLGKVRVRAAHVAVGRQVYLVAAVAPEVDFAVVGAEFAAALRSFRQLSSAEAAQVRPNHVTLYTARAGDSWQSIAQRAGGGLVPASLLALMNGYAVNVQPPVAATLKIVVPG